MDFAEEQVYHILFLPGVFPEDCENAPQYENVESENIEEIFEEYSEAESETGSVELEELGLEELDFSVARKNDDMVFDDIPTVFTDIEQWPETINIPCWLCQNRFSTWPYSIPYSRNKTLVPVYEDSQKLYDYDGAATEEPLMFSKQEYYEVSAYKMRGIFCGAICAHTYIFRVNDPEIINKNETADLFIEFYNKINGTNIITLPEAEDPTIQVHFCGARGITPEEYMRRNAAKLN